MLRKLFLEPRVFIDPDVETAITRVDTILGPFLEPKWAVETSLIMIDKIEQTG